MYSVSLPMTGAGIRKSHGCMRSGLKLIRVGLVQAYGAGLFLLYRRSSLTFCRAVQPRHGGPSLKSASIASETGNDLFQKISDFAGDRRQLRILDRHHRGDGIDC